MDEREQEERTKKKDEKDERDKDEEGREGRKTKIERKPKRVRGNERKKERVGMKEVSMILRMFKYMSKQRDRARKAR